MDYSQLNLRDNPFAMTPANGPPIWCGMGELKKKLAQRLEISMRTSPSALVINWGHYGSGKTHAAKYFTSEDTLAELSKSAGAVAAPLAFYVSFPRVDRGAATNLTSMIIGKFGVSEFADVLRNAKQTMDTVDTTLFPKLLNEYCQDSELQKLFLKLVDSDSQHLDTLGRLLFANASSADLKELQLARKADSLSDQGRIISTAFNLLTFRTDQITPRYSAIFLWIDEFEDISSLPAKEQDALAAYLRNLMDWSSRYLTVFLNFTLSPIQQVTDLSIYLGDAVSSRIRQRIEFAEPDAPQIKTYIREMLDNSGMRLTPASPELPYQPFDEAALEVIVGAIDPRTPRRVNEVCSFFIDLAAGEPKQNIITEQFVKAHSDDIGLVL